MPQATQPYVQDPPFCMQIELTEGCNLRCSFCGLNGIRAKDNNYKFMTIELAEHLAQQIVEAGWNCRLEFAMHGEPSMNPQFVELLRIFRKHLPKHPMMMTSNGAGYLKDPTLLVDSALESLNVLALDWYENVQIVPKILEQYDGIHTPLYYPENKEANPHHRIKPKERKFVIIQNIASATNGTHHVLYNHTGAGAPKNDNAAGLRCAQPFREMSIRWDGNVAICCVDWRGEYKCGNINELTLDQVWQSKAMQAARRKLYYGERTFGPCQGCDYKSYRSGLLPDKLGKKTLPKPDAKVEAELKKALAGEPYTLPVLRPWELVQIE